uniref:Uncharacterized protein n=1 Tax=Macrostomum lignano TaxID=282301 RepID=A0A1I8I7Z8_9PLAT
MRSASKSACDNEVMAEPSEPSFRTAWDPMHQSQVDHRSSMFSQEPQLVLSMALAAQAWLTQQCKPGLSIGHLAPRFH